MRCGGVAAQIWVPLIYMNYADSFKNVDDFTQTNPVWLQKSLDGVIIALKDLSQSDALLCEV